VENIREAIQAVKKDAFGKVVVSLDREASVLTTPPPAPKLVLDADATFILAGGLGALGLNIAKTMVAHGAKDLVFLSRSGGGSSQKELDEFREQGVRAEAFKCDVTQASSVASVFQQLKRQGRVVKGVIQCAMVLEVSN
jgi:short-subunit dehydrogenase involved in D-alanine esterification of teichoic acids